MASSGDDDTKDAASGQPPLREGDAVVVKMFKGMKAKQWFQRELMYMKRLATSLSSDSKYIVRYFGNASHKNIIAMEYCEKGDLSRLRWEEKKSIDLDFIRKLGEHLLHGVKALGEQNIVHMDMKPGNVFVHENASEGRTYKLGDFGLSKDFSKAYAKNLGGTPYYMPPEIKSHNKHWKLEMQHRRALPTVELDSRADVWTVGVILLKTFLVLGGDERFMPYVDDFEKFVERREKCAKRHGRTPEQKTELRPLYDLLNRMLQEDPKNRCDADAALKMPFFSPNVSTSSGWPTADDASNDGKEAPRDSSGS